MMTRSPMKQKFAIRCVAFLGLPEANSFDDQARLKRRVFFLVTAHFLFIILIINIYVWGNVIQIGIGDVQKDVWEYVQRKCITLRVALIDN